MFAVFLTFCFIRVAILFKNKPFLFCQNVPCRTDTLEVIGKNMKRMILSVNEALARLKELTGSKVYIYGTLRLDFEGNCISHVPTEEQHSHTDFGYASSIWVDFNLKKKVKKMIGQNRLSSFLDLVDFL